VNYLTTQDTISFCTIEVFMLMGWDYISEMRPPMAYWSSPKWYVSTGSHGGMILTGKTEELLRKTRRSNGPRLEPGYPPNRRQKLCWMYTPDQFICCRLPGPAAWHLLNCTRETPGWDLTSGPSRCKLCLCFLSTKPFHLTAWYIKQLTYDLSVVL
jgi:hypothetical protein